MGFTGIKVNNFSKEDTITKLQAAIGELPSTGKLDSRASYYMNKATGTFFCTLDKSIQSDYIEALLYFEDIIPILEKSGNRDDKIKAKHCYAAISSLRRMMGIF